MTRINHSSEVSENLPRHLLTDVQRLEHAEMQAALNSETVRAQAKKFRELEADLRGQIGRLTKQLTELNEVIDTDRRLPLARLLVGTVHPAADRRGLRREALASTLSVPTSFLQR